MISDQESSTDVESLAFRERLRQLVGEQSVRSFARNVGVSEGALRQYLSGKSEPTRPVLNAIARGANVDVAWLSSGAGEAQLDPSVIKIDIHPMMVFYSWLEEWWEHASPNERAWLTVQLERTFPEYAEWLKKHPVTARV